MPKIIAPSDKEIILKVKAYFEEEKRIKGPIIPYQKVHERVAAATGVSLHTVSNIVKEGAIAEASSTTIGALKKVKKIRKDKIQLNNDELDVIRKKVHDFYTARNQSPSIKKLHNTLREEIQFKGSREILRQYLRKIGLKYKKTKTNYKWVMVQSKPTLVKPSSKVRDNAKIFETQKVTPFCKVTIEDDAMSIVKEEVIPTTIEDDAISLVKQEVTPITIEDDGISHLKQEVTPITIEDNAISLLKHEVIPIYDVPDTSSKKNEIVQWLQDHNIEYSHDLKRAQLLKIVQGCINEYVHDDQQIKS